MSQVLGTPIKQQPEPRSQDPGAVLGAGGHGAETGRGDAGAQTDGAELRGG